MPISARGHSDGVIVMPELARTAEQQRPQRPAGRRDDADRDERVHGRGAVPGGPERGPVERPGGPRDDGQRERGDHPLPAGELQRRDHRQQQHGDGQDARDPQAAAQLGAARVGRGGRVLVRVHVVARAPSSARRGRARTGPCLVVHELARTSRGASCGARARGCRAAAARRRRSRRTPRTGRRRRARRCPWLAGRRSVDARADSSGRFTVASTPGSRFSFFSTRATQEAQVMPSIARSTVRAHEPIGHSKDLRGVTA